MQVLMCLLATLLLLGFGYIIWILAAKESGLNKTGGQCLAIAIKALAIIMFILCLVYGGRHMGGVCSPCGMGGSMMGNKMMMEKEGGKMDMMKSRHMMKEMGKEVPVTK